MKSTEIFFILRSISNNTSNALKHSKYILIFIASHIFFISSTFAACTTVTIDYWNANWYADAWLTKCGDTRESTFYASYNHNTVNIETGSRIRIGRTGTDESKDFIDTHPEGSAFNVLCEGRLDAGHVQYGWPTCKIVSESATKKSPPKLSPKNK